MVIGDTSLANIISNNVIRDNGKVLSDNTYDGVYLSGTASQNKISHNTIFCTTTYDGVYGVYRQRYGVNISAAGASLMRFTETPSNIGEGTLPQPSGLRGNYQDNCE